MMKRFLLILALMTALILPAALAEDSSPYTPGKVTEAMFAEAFSRGDMVTLNMQFNLVPSENAEEVFGEDAAELTALSELFENSIFSIGAGKIDGGLRVTLKGDYTVDTQTALLTATLDLTETGVALSSSALPGEQITANWETLLALAGMSEEEIASIMSLRSADFETMLAELITALEPVLDMVMQIAAPYGETIINHIASLPMLVNENVPAEAGYPAAAAEMQIQINDKAIGDLISALATQLKQDATLCDIFDAMLAESDPDNALTTALLCDALIEAVGEELTDESLPLNLFIGMDASGIPLYLNLSKELEDGTIALISLISGQIEETGGTLINFDILSLNAEQEIQDGISLTIAYVIDDANPNIMSAEVIFSGYANGAELLTCSFYTDNAVNPENPDAYDGLITAALEAADEESVATIGMDASLFSLRTENGEEMLIEGSIAVAADSENIQAVFEGTLVTELDGSTPVAVMTESIQLPDVGIAQWNETYTLIAAQQQADEVMTVTALETASAEEIDALTNRAVANLEQTLNTLLEILPAEFSEMAD